MNKRFGHLWRDNVIPLGLGVALGLICWLGGGGGAVNLPTGAALAWALWHLARGFVRWVRSGRERGPVG